MGKVDVAKLKPHPAAELFPMMTDAELDELAADIKAKGQLEPITVTGDGLVLDGRNRQEACRRAGVPVKCEEWHVAGSPTAWVLSRNLHRRHLTTDQRAAIAVKAKPMFAAEAKERQRAGAAKGGAARSAPMGAQLPRDKVAKKHRASEDAARSVGVGARTVERAERVLNERPELFERVLKGEKGLTFKKAEKVIVKEQRTKEVLEYKPPRGKYSVIAVDPPWRFDDELDGSDAARGGLQYPTMSLDEICAMKVGQTLATEDCVLWLWVPNAFVVDGSAARVLREWGFVGKCPWTWRKIDSKGESRMGAGRYGRNCTEQVWLAVKGRPVVNADDVANWFEAPRGEHSEKPARFYEIAEKVSPCAPEARLELFARAERNGWVTSGSELPKPSKKAGLHETPMKWDDAEPMAVPPDVAAYLQRRPEAAAKKPARKTVVDVPPAPSPPPAKRNGGPLEIEWTAKKHPAITAVGQGGGFKFKVERTRAQGAKKLGGFIWYRWPAAGREGRASSFPMVFKTEDEARLDAAVVARALRDPGTLMERYAKEQA